MSQAGPLFALQETLDSVGSTNDYLKLFVDEGRSRAVRSCAQTAGRGRNGRTWVSAQDEGLYASFLIFPDWPVAQAEALNMISVLAVIETIREMGPHLGDLVAAKRPNDVLIRGRKVCGVLVELGSQSGRIQWAVAGIGLNLDQTAFPPMGRHLYPPTSLRIEGVEVDGPGFAFQRLTHHLRALLLTVLDEPGRLPELKVRFQHEVSDLERPSDPASGMAAPS